MGCTEAGVGVTRRTDSVSRTQLGGRPVLVTRVLRSSPPSMVVEGLCARTWLPRCRGDRRASPCGRLVWRTGLGDFWKCRPHRPWKTPGTAQVTDNPELWRPPFTGAGVTRRHASAGTSVGGILQELWLGGWPASLSITSPGPSLLWPVSVCPGLWL